MHENSHHYTVPVLDLLIVDGRYCTPSSASSSVAKSRLQIRSCIPNRSRSLLMQSSTEHGTSDRTPWLVHSFEIRTLSPLNTASINTVNQPAHCALLQRCLRPLATRSSANAKLRQIAYLKVIPTTNAAVAPDFYRLSRQLSSGGNNLEITPWTPECACRGPNGFEARIMIGEKPRALRYISR